MRHARNEKRETTEWTYQIKKDLELLEKRKHTNMWVYWKLTSGDERKKLRKSISGKPESYSRQNYITKIL